MPASEMRKMWDAVQNLANLKVMNLEWSKHLTELPDFSKATSLKSVDLTCCSSLSKVHPSILSLQNLEQLRLFRCHALTSLKSDVHLKSLHELQLNECSRLKEISITADNMRYLNLRRTAIDSLPSGIGRMSELRHLDISWSKNLKNIPINLFDGLQFLCCLGLNRCLKLQSLPELPPSLKYLEAERCSSLETVTSFAYRMNIFDNCNNLSEHSIKAIQANLMVHTNRSLSQLETRIFCLDYFSVGYPGSRVPEWFKYRTAHHSITVDLSFAPLSMDWGLIFCICLGSTPTETELKIEYAHHLEIDGQTVGLEKDLFFDTVDKDIAYFQWKGDFNLTSDHVFLFYNGYFCHRIHRRIKKSRASSNSKIELILDVFSPQVDDLVGLIRECGVCPTYESEYQNFMKRMGLESQASASKTQGDQWKEDNTLFDSESIRDKKRPRLDNK